MTMQPTTAERGGGSQTSLEDTLARIEARLSRIEQAVEPARAMRENASNVLATITDVLDEKMATLGDVDGRLRALSELTERVSRQETLASLSKLVAIAESAPGLVATVTDVLDEVMSEAGKDGLELAQVFESTRKLLFGLLKLTSSSELQALLESGMVEPRALRALGRVATSLVEVSALPAPRVGMFGALRALSNDDVQRALGFVLQFAAGFGRTLDAADGQEPTGRITSGRTRQREDT